MKLFLKSFGETKLKLNFKLYNKPFKNNTTNDKFSYSQLMKKLVKKIIILMLLPFLLKVVVRLLKNFIIFLLRLLPQVLSI